MRFEGVEERRRWERPAEYWEHRHEMFSGETVLQDCARMEPDDRAAGRFLLVRFLAVQFFVNLLRGDTPPRVLVMQRAEALNHLGTALTLDREQRALRRAVDACRAEFTERGVAHLLTAAESALARGHTAGAFALYRLCYEAALRPHWYGLAARAARGIEQLARAGGGPRSRKRWARRATVLERRAAAA